MPDSYIDKMRQFVPTLPRSSAQALPRLASHSSTTEERTSANAGRSRLVLSSVERQALQKHLDVVRIDRIMKQKGNQNPMSQNRLERRKRELVQ